MNYLIAIQSLSEGVISDIYHLNNIVNDNSKSIQIELLIIKYNIWILEKISKENDDLEKYKFYNKHEYIDLIWKLFIDKFYYMFELNYSSNTNTANYL